MSNDADQKHLYAHRPPVEAARRDKLARIEIGPKSTEAACPVVALQRWMEFARVSHGPLFRRVRDAKVGADRLNDRHVALLVKRLVVAAGVRADLSEDREGKFSGRSLRAGLASAEMTRRY